MSRLLNAIYVCFLVIGSPWLLWRILVARKNRRGWNQKLLGLVESRESNNACIWMHAVSVGEVNLLAPIIRQIELVRPDLDIVISTGTETGFDLATRKFPSHYSFFCPFDFTWAINRVLKRIRPSMLVLAELELWPNLIKTTRDAGVPVAVVNGRLSANSFRGYRRFHWLIRQTFERLSLVAAQNESYAQRFLSLGCNPASVQVTGSVKFDGVETDPDNRQSQKLARIAGIGSHDQVFVAGSTQIEEDLMAARVHQRLCQSNPNRRLILVPRHPQRCGALATQLSQIGVESILRSRLQESPDIDGISSVDQPGDQDEHPDSTNPPVLIVDVIGELAAWWGCADAAYVGGSLGRRGGQNMIEPAAYGVPVSFGPNTENFREIVQELLAHDAAVVIHDDFTLSAFVERAFTNSDWSKTIGKRAREVVASHLGASQKTVELLDVVLSKSDQVQAESETSSVQAA